MIRKAAPSPKKRRPLQPADHRPQTAEPAAWPALSGDCVEGGGWSADFRAAWPALHGPGDFVAPSIVPADPDTVVHNGGMIVDGDIPQAIDALIPDGAFIVR